MALAAPAEPPEPFCLSCSHSIDSVRARTVPPCVTTLSSPKLEAPIVSTTARAHTSRGSGGGGSLLVSEPVGCPLVEVARPPFDGVTFATTNSVKVTSAVPPDSSGIGC